MKQSASSCVLDSSIIQSGSRSFFHPKMNMRPRKRVSAFNSATFLFSMFNKDTAKINPCSVSHAYSVTIIQTLPIKLYGYSWGVDICGKYNLSSRVQRELRTTFQFLYRTIFTAQFHLPTIGKLLRAHLGINCPNLIFTPQILLTPYLRDFLQSFIKSGNSFLHTDSEKDSIMILIFLFLSIFHAFKTLQSL